MLHAEHVAHLLHTRLVKDRSIRGSNFSPGRVNKPHARRRSGAGSSWPPIQKYFHSGIRSCMRYRMHLAVVRAPVMQRRLCSWSAHDHLIKFIILVRQVQGRFSGDHNLEKLQSRYILYTSVSRKLGEHAARLFRFYKANVFLDAKHLQLNRNLQRQIRYYYPRRAKRPLGSVGNSSC